MGKGSLGASSSRDGRLPGSAAIFWNVFPPLLVPGTTRGSAPSSAATTGRTAWWERSTCGSAGPKMAWRSTWGGRALVAEWCHSVRLDFFECSSLVVLVASSLAAETSLLVGSWQRWWATCRGKRRQGGTGPLPVAPGETFKVLWNYQHFETRWSTTLGRASSPMTVESSCTIIGGTN